MAQEETALTVSKAVDRDLGVGDGCGLARDEAIDGHGRRAARHQAGLCSDGVGGVCQIRGGEASFVLRAVGHCQHVQGEGSAVVVGIQRHCAEDERYQLCCIRVEAAAVEQAVGTQVAVEDLGQAEGVVACVISWRWTLPVGP